MDYLYILADAKTTCDNLFTPDALNIINELLSYFRILTPFVLAIMVAVDLIGIMLSSNAPGDKSYHKYISRIVRRSLAAILVFMVPTIIAILLSLDGVKDSIAVDPLCLQAKGTASTKTDVYDMFGIDNGLHPQSSSSSGSSESTSSEGGESESTGSSSNATTYGPADSSKRSRKSITINGRTYDMYIQRDFPDIPFTGQNISDAGCSAVAFLQAASGFDRNLTIYDAAKLVKERTFTGIEGALRSVGLSYSSIIYYNSNDYNKAREAQVCEQVRAHLSQGKPAIALLNGAPYAGDNHFVTLYGEDENGNLITGNCRKEVGSLEEMVANSLRGGRKGFLLVG